MSFYHFRLLLAAVQLRYALTQDTYLVHRWNKEDDVNLCHGPNEDRGFYV